MIHTMFYLISPRPDLIEVAKGAPDTVLAEYLSSPKLWTARLADKGPITGGEMECLIKGLYLLDLCGMPEVANFVGALGEGEIRVSSDYFDRFWLICRVPEDNSVAEAITNFRGDSRLQEFTRTIGDGALSFVNAAIAEQQGNRAT